MRRYCWHGEHDLEMVPNPVPEVVAEIKRVAQLAVKKLEQEGGIRALEELYLASAAASKSCRAE